MARISMLPIICAVVTLLALAKLLIAASLGMKTVPTQLELDSVVWMYGTACRTESSQQLNQRKEGFMHLYIPQRCRYVLYHKWGCQVRVMYIF